MRAARVLEPNKIEIMEVDEPDIGPGDVLCRVKYVGLCHTDKTIFDGTSFLIKDGYVKYPITLGHEWSGYVEKTGSEVKRFKQGDRVIGDTCVSCGKCAACMSGKYNLCQHIYGIGTVGNWDGAFAQYIKYPEKFIYKLPDTVDLEDAALIEPAAIAGYAVERAGVEAADVVLVHGTGAIGLFAVQFARIFGASHVILSGRKDFKLEIGKIIGADTLININSFNVQSVVKDITNGEGVDRIIETSGSVSALGSSFELLRSGGTISVPSFFNNNLESMNINDIVLRDITLKGSVGSPGFFPKSIKLLSSGRLKCKPLITHQLKFGKIKEAFELMGADSKNRIKIVLEMDS